MGGTVDHALSRAMSLKFRNNLEQLSMVPDSKKKKLKIIRRALSEFHVANGGPSYRNGREWPGSLTPTYELPPALGRRVAHLRRRALLRRATAPAAAGALQPLPLVPSVSSAASRSAEMTFAASLTGADFFCDQCKGHCFSPFVLHDRLTEKDLPGSLPPSTITLKPPSVILQLTVGQVVRAHGLYSSWANPQIPNRCSTGAWSSTVASKHPFGVLRTPESLT